MNRRSVIITVAVVAAIHAVAVTLYLVRTDRLDSVLTALTPVPVGDRAVENAYTPPLPSRSTNSRLPLLRRVRQTATKWRSFRG